MIRINFLISTDGNYAARMKSEDISQKTVRSYLIGDLDAATVEALDELSIVDEEFAVRLAAEQYDLVDDWVGGRLDRSEHAAFAKALARSPTLGEKVKISQLMAAAPRVAVVGRLPEPGSFARLFAGIPRFAYGLAGLLLLLGVVAAISFFVRSEDSVELTHVIDDSPTNVTPVQTPAEPTEQVSTPMVENNSRPARPSSPKPPPQPRREATRSIVALALSPPTRGAGGISAVKMDPGVDYLELTVGTEAQNSGPFVVEMGDASSGKIVWRSAPVHGRIQKGHTIVSVRIPSARLPKGFRTIRLQTADPSADVLDEHLIRIDR